MIYDVLVGTGVFEQVVCVAARCAVNAFVFFDTINQIFQCCVHASSGYCICPVFFSEFHNSASVRGLRCHSLLLSRSKSA